MQHRTDTQSQRRLRMSVFLMAAAAHEDIWVILPPAVKTLTTAVNTPTTLAAQLPQSEPCSNMIYNNKSVCLCTHLSSATSCAYASLRPASALPTIDCARSGASVPACLCGVCVLVFAAAAAVQQQAAVAEWQSDSDSLLLRCIAAAGSLAHCAAQPAANVQRQRLRRKASSPEGRSSHLVLNTQ